MKFKGKAFFSLLIILLLVMATPVLACDDPLCTKEWFFQHDHYIDYGVGEYSYFFDEYGYGYFDEYLMELLLDTSMYGLNELLRGPNCCERPIWRLRGAGFTVIGNHCGTIGCETRRWSVWISRACRPDIEFAGYRFRVVHFNPWPHGNPCGRCNVDTLRTTPNSPW